MPQHKCWLCGVVCDSGHVVVEAQWSHMNGVRDAAALGVEQAAIALENRIAGWRAEAETSVSMERLSTKIPPPRTRHLVHFIAIRNKNRTRMTACVRCIDEVCKMWTQLQMQMHAAIGEILGWVDWYTLEVDDLYDHGIRDVCVDDKVRQAMLRKRDIVRYL